jgi:hypothetical protein
MTEVQGEKRRVGWLGLLVAVVFGLFYAYDLWEAIENAIELPKLYEQLEAVGLGSGGVPWTFVGIAIALPPVAFVLALLVGRRRNPLGRALVFAAGLVLVAALSLSVNSIAGAV